MHAHLRTALPISVPAETPKTETHDIMNPPHCDLYIKIGLVVLTHLRQRANSAVPAWDPHATTQISLCDNFKHNTVHGSFSLWFNICRSNQMHNIPDVPLYTRIGHPPYKQQRHLHTYLNERGSSYLLRRSVSPDWDRVRPAGARAAAGVCVCASSRGCCGRPAGGA